MPPPPRPNNTRTPILTPTDATLVPLRKAATAAGDALAGRGTRAAALEAFPAAEEHLHTWAGGALQRLPGGHTLQVGLLDHQRCALYRLCCG